MLRNRCSRPEGSAGGEASAVAVVSGVLCLPLAFAGAAVTGEEGVYPAGYEVVARTDGDHWVALLSLQEQAAIAEQQRQETKDAREKFKKQMEEAKKKREEELRRQQSEMP